MYILLFCAARTLISIALQNRISTVKAFLSKEILLYTVVSKIDENCCKQTLASLP